MHIILITIKGLLSTEKSMSEIEMKNILVFAFDIKATKQQIKDLLNKLGWFTPVRVNTMISMNGYKKAYVKVAPGQDAMELWERLSKF